ncbi:MAG: tRNA (guanosine(37)-N1)-methyltransferase TrmD [Planctomycetota bacterium]|jgi:tRNA (guanine37-N1)-methyltransferase
MKIDVVTLFPAMFEGILRESILKIAQQKGLAEVNLLNLRDFSPDKKHRKVDAPPYGGGPGMVLQAEPAFGAVEYLRSKGREKSKLVLLSAAGVRLDQTLARELAREKGLVLLCGHYEGVDERVVEGLDPLEISIGDYVLTGGEVPAMVLLEAVVRCLPGVLGCGESLGQESFSEGLLEYPQYTRPQEFRGMKVPDVLVSGNHAQIEKWRREESEKRTRERRPDLWEKLRKRASKDDTIER